MKTKLILLSSILIAFNCSSQTKSIIFKYFSNPSDTSLFLTVTNKTDSVVFVNDGNPTVLKHPNSFETSLYLFQSGVTLNKPTPSDFIDVKRISKNSSYATQIKLGSEFFNSDTIVLHINLQLAMALDSTVYFMDKLLPYQIQDLCANQGFTIVEQRIALVLIKKDFFSCINNSIAISNDSYRKYNLKKSWYKTTKTKRHKNK